MKKKVKIKTWEEMLECGTLDGEGDIVNSLSLPPFTSGMEMLMPKDRIVEIDERMFWDVKHFTWYAIDEWMISEEVCSVDRIDKAVSSLYFLGDLVNDRITDIAKIDGNEGDRQVLMYYRSIIVEALDLLEDVE